MSLIVGVDTYCTISEADSYVQNYYLPDDLKRELWESLDESSKEIYLRKATRFLESLTYTGRKYSKDQTLSFPRNRANKIPSEVIQAEIIQALFYLHPAEDESEQMNRMEMQRQGIVAYRIGDLSESYKTSTASNNPVAISSVQQLLNPYILGGYEIHANHLR